MLFFYYYIEHFCKKAFCKPNKALKVWKTYFLIYK